MKRLPIFWIATILMACNNEKQAEEKKESASAITYPYTAEYSSDFNMGNPQHAKTVLDLFKMWEDNKISDMKSLLADSVSIDFPDGNKFNSTADSLIRFAVQYRSSIPTIKTIVEAWTAVHLADKNEDYVLVWARDYMTDTSGKMDSVRTHAYFQIKDNKIRHWSEFQQKLAAPSPMPAASK